MEIPRYTPEEEDQLRQLNQDLARAGILDVVIRMLEKKGTAERLKKPHIMTPFYLEEPVSKDPYEQPQRQIVVGIQWVEVLNATNTIFQSFGFPRDYKRSLLDYKQTERLYSLPLFEAPKGR